jgi:hypothetical protein
VGESCRGAQRIAAVSFEHSTLGVFSLRVSLDANTNAGERDDFVFRTLLELGASTADTSNVSFCEASSNNVFQPFQYSARFDSVAAASTPRFVHFLSICVFCSCFDCVPLLPQ